MKTTEAPLFKKLSLLLAVLLCSLFAFAVPVVVKAAPIQDAPQKESIHSSHDAPFSIVAGEVCAGEAEGILQQVEKSLWSPFTKALFQLLYPQSLVSEGVPSQYPFPSRSIILHSILTKGP